MIKNLAVHGSVKIYDIENTDVPAFGAFLDCKSGEKGEALVFFDHFEDKLCIADLQKWGKQDVLRGEITVEGLSVIGIFFRQEEWLPQQLLQPDFLFICQREGRGGEENDLFLLFHDFIPVAVKARLVQNIDQIQLIAFHHFDQFFRRRRGDLHRYFWMILSEIAENGGEF